MARIGFVDGTLIRLVGFTVPHPQSEGRLG